MPRANGSRTSKLAGAIRTKKVLELTASGASQEVIAQELGVSIPTVWSDISKLDLIANASIEPAEMRLKLRTDMLAKLQKWEEEIAAEPDLDIMERTQLFLAVQDRKIRTAPPSEMWT